MLQLIICPKCGTEYKKKNIYFCFNCGSRLPKPETNNNNSAKKKEKKKSGPELKTRETKKSNFLLLILTLIFFGSATLFIYTYKLHTLTANWANSTDSRSNLNKVELIQATPSAIPQTVFVNNKEDWLLYYASFTPKNANVFILTSHANKLQLPQLDNAIKERIENEIKMEVEDILTYIEPHYAVIKQDSQNALLATAKNSKFIEQQIEKLQFDKISGYTAKIHNDLLVIADSEAIHKDIEATINNAGLSIAQSTEFDKVKRSLPTEGQVYIFGKAEDLWLIPEEVRKNKSGPIGFVINKEDGKTVYYSSK